MYYIVDSDKSFYEACLDLTPVVQRLGWTVVHADDLAVLLGSQTDEHDEDCRVHEIVNHRLAERLLAEGLGQALELPWRINVFTEKGVTRIAARLPEARHGLAAEISERLRQIVDEVR